MTEECLEDINKTKSVARMFQHVHISMWNSTFLILSKLMQPCGGEGKMLCIYS